MIRAGHRFEHFDLIASELGMVPCDLAGPDPLEQRDHSTIRVAYLRENWLVIGHVQSLANRSDESVNRRPHRPIRLTKRFRPVGGF